LGDDVRLAVVTNGSLLTSERINELLACGLDHVSVSMDAYEAATYDQVRKGLDLSQVVRNTETLLQRAGRVRVTVRFLRQRANAGEEASFARRWKSRGAHVRFDTLTNRAGMVGDFEKIRREDRPGLAACISALLNRLFPLCPLPFAWLNVLWDGRVPLCPHDWAVKQVVGDLSKRPLPEVWNGEAMNHYRHLLWTRHLSESAVCSACSLGKRFWNA
jgi:hypothetical protein